MSGTRYQYPERARPAPKKDVTVISCKINLDTKRLAWVREVAKNADRSLAWVVKDLVEQSIDAILLGEETALFEERSDGIFAKE